MSNININLGTLLPKMATILPLVVITMNIISHLYLQKSISNSEYVWMVLGLIASGYFGIFCKAIE